MKNQNHKPAGSFRLYSVLALFAMASGILVWRGVDLHVFQRDHLQKEGDARSLRVIPLATNRGMISDRNGEPLAISTPVDSVWVHPGEFLSAKKYWPRLGALLKLDSSELHSYILKRKDREFAYLKRRINPELAQQVMDLQIPGVALLREYRRYYPLGEVAAHVVGFTDVDDKGQEGLELAYEDQLQSHPGSKRVLRDRLGHTIEDVELISPAESGQDIALSIDRRLQYLAYRELKRAVLKHRARSGSAVILDSRTGEVLAMVNQPAFNPNNREQLKSYRYRNRAVTDLFEPGSAIKPFTVAAAIENRLFSPGSLIETGPGYMKVGHNTVRDIRNYGKIDVSTVLMKSSNVGATKIAMSMQPRQFWKMLTQVGFGIGTASGFPGEADGVLADYRHWRSIEQATLSFGYGISVTNLQLAQAYAILANHGIKHRISFLRTSSKTQGERVMRAATAKQVVKMLEGVVSVKGTAAKAAVPGYRIAGKTGTVKKAGAGGYLEDRYLSVFVGIAPASDPRLVMVVSIDDPRGEVYYGGEVAAPVFSRVMSRALPLLNIPMDDLSNPSVKLAFVGGEK